MRIKDPEHPLVDAAAGFLALVLLILIIALLHPEAEPILQAIDQLDR